MILVILYRTIYKEWFCCLPCLNFGDPARDPSAAASRLQTIQVYQIPTVRVGLRIPSYELPGSHKEPHFMRWRPTCDSRQIRRARGVPVPRRTWDFPAMSLYGVECQVPRPPHSTSVRPASIPSTTKTIVFVGYPEFLYRALKEESTKMMALVVNDRY